jgi:hypothetical protein
MVFSAGIKFGTTTISIADGFYHLAASNDRTNTNN